MLAITAIIITSAKAELITIAIEAEVNNVSDSAGHLEGKISAGSLISGYYIYEFPSMDSDSSTNTGLYWQSHASCGMFLSAGGFEFNTDAADILYFIGVEDDLSGKDKYLIESSNNLTISNGVEVERIFWQLEDSTMTVLDSDLLPLAAPDLNAWDDNLLYINGGPRESDFTILATVTSAQLVPEPATMMLLLFGAALLRKRTL